MSCAGSQSFIELSTRAYFDFYRDAGVARAPERGRYAARRRDVVVFDQHCVEQAHAMIGGARGGDRHFFETAQTGSRLSGVENHAAGAFDGTHVSAGKRGDAPQTLKEVQRDALAGEQRARRTAHGRDLVTAVKARSRTVTHVDRAALENQWQHFDSGKRKGLAREQAAGGLRAGGYTQTGGDVAGTDIFGQRPAHGVQDFGMGHRTASILSLGTAA